MPNQIIDIIFSLQLDEYFLSKLRLNNIGKFCINNDTILKIVKGKVGKAVNSQRSVRQEMRQLGRIYGYFCKEHPAKLCGDVRDMFVGKNF